jgi:hypothetical protein
MSMNIQDQTLTLIIEHGLTVRQIPYEVVSHWGYREGDPILKNSEIVEKGGRNYMKQVKIPTHAGKWMAKKCVDTNSQVHWNIKNDNLSDTLQEAVLKATQDK